MNFTHVAIIKSINKGLCSLILTLSILNCGGSNKSDDSSQTSQNQAPVIELVNKQTITDQETVELNVKANDNDGTIVRYSWKQIAGSNVTIHNGDTASASFSTNDIYESSELQFSITVTDDDGATETKTIVVDIQLNSIAIQPNSIFYQQDERFNAGQYILLTSNENINQPVTITTSDGKELTLAVDGSGNLYTQLPAILNSGEWLFKIKNGSNVYNLTIEVNEPLIITQPEQIINDQLAMIINELEQTQQRLTQRDQVLDNLIEQLSNIHDQLPGLSNDELQYFANLIQANQLSEVFTINQNSNSLSKSDGTIITKDTNSCLNLTRKMVVTGTVVNILAGATAVEPTGIGKILFLGTGITAAYKFLSYADSFFQSNCLGLASFKNAIFNNPTRIAKELPVNTFLAKPLEEDVNVNWYDGTSERITVLYLNQLPEAPLAILNKLSSVLSLIGDYAPEHVVNLINRLKKPKEVDTTEDVQFSWINSANAECSGTPLQFSCGFPKNDNIYDSASNIIITVSHPLLTEQGSFTIKILPRDKPALEDQTFSVVAGSGKTNIIKIAFTEDKNSPFYDLTKITSFEVVEKPSWGVILNEFRTFAEIEYAADLGDDMPIQDTIVVRASNRYGWSETATLNLVFNSDFPADMAATYNIKVISTTKPPAIIAENGNLILSCRVSDSPRLGDIETFIERWQFNFNTNSVLISGVIDGSHYGYNANYNPSTQTVSFTDNQNDGCNQGCSGDDVKYFSSGVWQVTATYNPTKSESFGQAVFEGNVYEEQTTSWSYDNRSRTCIYRYDLTIVGRKY